MRCQEWNRCLGLCFVWLVQAGCVLAADAPEISTPAPRPATVPAAEPERPEGDPVVLQLVLIELKGNVQQALKAAGFRESASSYRFVSTLEQPVGQDPDRLPAVLKTLSAHAELKVLSRPQVRTIMGQACMCQIGTTPAPIPYFVRTGTKMFELREFTTTADLGLMISLTPQPGDDANLIDLSPLKISTTTLDGREPISGLDLDVGKPIVSTRTLETSFTLSKGTEVNGIALPGPSDHQPILFISIRGPTSLPAAAEPLPSPPSKRRTFPNPVP